MSDSARYSLAAVASGAPLNFLIFSLLTEGSWCILGSVTEGGADEQTV